MKIRFRRKTRLLQAFAWSTFVGCAMMLLIEPSFARIIVQTDNDLVRIKELEKQLFQRTLSEPDLNLMLNRLADPTRRESTATQLIGAAKGCQDSIAQFANTATDIDVRETCAEIVAQLDDGWRTTNAGKELLTINKSNAESNLPGAWKRLLADPTDQAAAAMILAPDPNVVWRWIDAKYPKRNTTSAEKKSANPPGNEERALYLLLRIRDLSPDPFSAQHIPEISNFDVFGYHIFPDFYQTRSFRQVGHVFLKRLNRESIMSFHGPDKYAYRLVPKQFGVFQYGAPNTSAANKLQLIHFTESKYGPYTPPSKKNQNPKNNLTVQELVEFERMYGSLPRRKAKSDTEARFKFSDILLSREHYDNRNRFMLKNRGNLVPWWWRRYVSDTNANRMSFEERDDGPIAPAELSDKIVIGIAPTGTPNTAPAAKKDAPSFVILPPRLGRPSEPDSIAADLAVDRIAEEMQRQSVQIVDRKHLKMILEERQRNRSSEPMTGFDAFVRLEVTNEQLETDATLSIVDLSTGSAIAAETFQWPIPEAKIDDVRSLLKTAIKNVRRPQKKQIKIRLLGVRQPESIRMRPLATRLEEKFDAAFRGHRLSMVVDHIEAGSSAEESAMLLFGLSEIPGERRFGPAADATLGMTLTERIETGKSFEYTVVEVRYILQVPGQVEQSETIVGTVGKFDSHLMPELWKRIGARLGKVKPGAANQPVDMATRKSQAARELAAIKNIDSNLSDLEQALARRHHAQAALKLDPTSAEAALELIQSHSAILMADRRSKESEAIAWEGIELMADRIDQFSGQPEVLEKLDSALRRFRFQVYRQTRSKSNKNPTAAERELILRNFDLNIRMAELQIDGPLADLSDGLFSSLEYGFLGLHEFGADKTQLHQRLLAILEHLDRLQELHSKKRAGNERSREETQRGYEELCLRRLRHAAFEISTKLQFVDVYDRLLPSVKKDLLATSFQGRSKNLLLKDIEKLGDDKRVAEFNSWLTIDVENVPTVSLYDVPFHNVDIFQKTKWATAATTEYKIDLPAGFTVSPLALTKRRLYFLASNCEDNGWWAMNSGFYAGNFISNRQKLGFLPLGTDGNPSGAAEFIPLPPKAVPLMISSCVADKDTLILGTIGAYNGTGAGLYVLDVSKDKWKYFGVKEGLPVKWIACMHQLSNGQLLCTGEAERGKQIILTFDLRSEAIRQQSVQETHSRLNLMCVFESSRSIHGYTNRSIWRDLLSRSPSHSAAESAIRGDDGTRHGDIRHACQHGNEIFYFQFGLHAASLSGKVRKTWHRRARVVPQLVGPWAFTHQNIAIDEAPIQDANYLLSCGDLLLLFANKKESLVGYDPKSDTWYGPVKIPRNSHAIAAGDHVWLGGKSLYQLPITELIRASEQYDRVMTTEEFAARQIELIETTDGLERAKLELCAGRFAESQKFLDSVLEREPDNASAQLVMGMNFDTWAGNQPAKSAAAYQRASEIATKNGEHSLAFTASFLHSKLLRSSGQKQRAAEAAQEILANYPHIKTDRIKSWVREIAEGG